MAVLPESFELVVSMAAAEAREQGVTPLEAMEVFAGSGNLSEALVEHGMCVWSQVLQERRNRLSTVCRFRPQEGLEEPCTAPTSPRKSSMP